ncbi:MAG: Hpt domain-containing protein, partial [Burkholderiales bacterium]
MDSPRADSDRHEPIDLSALAWVHDELRRSLDAAHKALRRFMKDSDTVFDADTDDVDPSVLRSARQQIHQGVGALELVGLPAAAIVLRASESVVQRLVAKPRRVGPQTVDAIERVSFALLDYIGRLLAGKRVSALSLFPQYRVVQELAGAERVHPSDLWVSEWRWVTLPDDPTAQPLATDARSEQLLEQQLLGLMRAGGGEKQAAAFDRMSHVCAGLGAGTSQPKAATLWKLASAVFEAQAHGLLKPDVFSKRAASRLLPQFRILNGGSDEVSDRLAQDLLFFCSQADSPGAGRTAPRLAAVRQTYHLDLEPPADYNVSVLGRFDPALIAQAKKRVTSAKDAWGAVAGGDVHRLAGLTEQFSLVGDSLRRLIPAGDALDDGEFEGLEQRERVAKLAQRITAVRSGEAPKALDAWMEELYRRVSERQTLGSVVHEMRAALSESEKLIDRYFRNPAEREVLTPVPAQLQAMRGVLSVLGLDHASHAALRMRDDIDALLQTEVDPQRASVTGTFDRLAGNLGALGFLIDMLSVQPQMAKSLFRFDAASGTLVSVMGQQTASAVTSEKAVPATAGAPPRLLEQAQTLAFSAARADVELIDVTRDLERLSHEAQVADQLELVAAVATAQAALDSASDELAISAARASLSEALVEFVHTSTDAAGLEPLARLPAVASPDAGGGDLAGDDEMREVFLEEAREVLDGAQEALTELRSEPGELERLTILRRAFHTLKGSSRMVGLHDYGAAAWICEQQYNTVLAEQRAAEPALLDFTAAALEELGAWVDTIAGGLPLEGFRVETMQRRADALMGVGSPPAEGVALPPLAPEWSDTSALADGLHAEAPAAPEEERGIEEDVAFTLDFGDTVAPDALPADATQQIEVPPVAEAEELNFEFDLGAFDEGGVASARLGEAAPAEPAFSGFDVFATQPYPHDRLSSPALPPDVPADEPIEIDAGPLDEVVEQAEPGLSAFQDTGFDTAFDTAFDAEAVGGARAHAEPRVEDEQFKQVGDLRIAIPLFNIYLNEADELSRRLGTELAEWAMELHRPVGDGAVALAHSLAGSSATVGFADLSHLSRALEHALERSHSVGYGNADEAQLYVDVAEDIRRLLHQFAAGFLKTPQPGLLERLAEREAAAQRLAQARSESEDGAGAIGGDTAADALALETASQQATRDDDEVQADLPVAIPEIAAEAEAETQAEAEAAPETDHEAAREATHDVAPESTEPSGVEAPLEAVSSAFAASAFAAADSQHGAFGLPELKTLDELPEPVPEAAYARDDADDD